MVDKFKEFMELNPTPEEQELIKPFYSTGQLKRYFAESDTDEWVIYTRSDINKMIKNIANGPEPSPFLYPDENSKDTINAIKNAANIPI